MDWSSSPTARDIAVRTELTDEVVLGAVGILELVHQQEGETILVELQPVGPLPEQGERVQQQVVEIHGVGGVQRRLVRPEHVGRHLRRTVELVGTGQRLGALHPVLGARDQILDDLGREQLGRVPAGIHQPTDQRELVVLVIDGELNG